MSGWDAEGLKRRVRVVSDNDYGGDPDGLLQLAQHLLSPNVDLRLVIGSHLKENDGFDPSPTTADKAALAARRIAELCGRENVPVLAGSNTPLRSRTEPVQSAAAAAIVAEAMRDDDVPLFVCCGAGLTEIASAWLLEPRIAQRLTLVWIGGHEHPGLAEPPPDGTDMEYNLDIDPIAGQVVFNDSDLPIWHVPRDMYRTVMASRAELLLRVARHGELGKHLYDALAAVVDMASSHGFDLGEIYILGDSPLVLLTALLSSFQPDAASSSSVTVPCPRILDSGLYESTASGRPIRVFTQLDNRLLLEDLYAKLELHALGLT